MQGQHLLLANKRNSTATNGIQTLAWFADAIEVAAAPSPVGSSTDGSAGSASTVSTSGTATAIASFVLSEGTMQEQAMARVLGDLRFEGAMAYDSSTNVLSVLSTVRDDTSSGDTAVRNSVFAVLEPTELTTVRCLPLLAAACLLRSDPLACHPNQPATRAFSASK